MKLLLAVSALAVVAFAAPSGSDHVLQAIFQAKFNNFKSQFGKVYAAHEEKVRLQNYIKNTLTLETHNEKYAKGTETYFLKHNDMSDLSHEEYLSTRLGSTPPEYMDTNNVTMFETAPGWSRPDSIDWRVWGHVSPIRNQGQCGSCYSFSTVATLEAHYYRKHNQLLEFSEQQLVDCSKKYHQGGGCNGGWMHNCYKYLIDAGGINLRKDYPYEEKEGTCRFNSRKAYARPAKYVMIKQHSEDELADAVASVGPVSVAYDASSREFMMYGGGIFYSDRCSKYAQSHAVVVVGYGVENNVPFWTIKNSWGDWWGEKGYFRMKRNIDNKCGIATYASYPVL